MPPTRRSNFVSNPSGLHIFEGRYFNMMRIVLLCLGLGPYENKVKNIVLRVIASCTSILLSIPQLISINLHYQNMDRLMLNVLIYLSMLVVILKVVGMMIADENMIKLYESIENNRQLIQDQSERDILHEYSQRGRSRTIFFGTAIAIFTVIGLTLPLLPKFLDVVNPLENPRPEIIIMGGEYLIDRRSHPILFWFADYLPLVLGASVIITVDSIYIIAVEHCCMLFGIVRYRLMELKQRVQKRSLSDEGVDSYEWLRSTIQLHQEALIFTSLLGDSYSIGLLFLVTAALVVCPLNCCAIIANLDEPLHTGPYVAFYVALMFQGFFIFHPGQRLIDHQLELYDAAYYNEWYVTPRRTRKMLLILMLRSTEPTAITAGGILPINHEVYLTVLKTTMSYVTVAWSFR